MLKKYEVTVHYNVIKKKIEILLPSSRSFCDNQDNVALTHVISMAALNDIPTQQVPAYVEAIAEVNPYNPVEKWIDSKPWDGTDRICAIVGTIQAREGFPDELKHTLIYKWLLSCVAAALCAHGFKARGVLTLQGAQGTGKTSWVLSLVSDPTLRDAVIKIDHHLDGNNKDSILTAITHWIVEIGELDSSFKKDVARLKGFLTSDQDKVRRPYARGDSEYARRTVFSATVNATDFLVDTTGNSRWWTLPVESINYQHGIDTQQLFAQLAIDFKKGMQWWLTKDEDLLLETYNRDHRSISAIHERLMEHLDMGLKDEEGNPAMAAIDVLTMLTVENPSNGQCKECAAILRDLFGDAKKIKGRQTWRVPIKREPRKKFPGLPDHPDDLSR